MMGLQYVGKFDELAIFDRALDAGEVKRLHALPQGLKEIVPRKTP